MAYVVIAYIVMASIVTACTVMAYIVIVNIVMASVVMVYIVMDYMVMAYVVMVHIVMALPDERPSCRMMVFFDRVDIISAKSSVCSYPHISARILIHIVNLHRRQTIFNSQLPGIGLLCT